MTGARPLRVLVLEDCPPDAELMIYELRRHGLAPEWRRVETEAAYLAALDVPPDVVLSDYSLPAFDAIEALGHLRRRGLDIPFLVVTGNVSDEVAVACMKAGASDLLNKDRLARLAPAVEQALAGKRLRDEKASAEREREESRALFAAAFTHTPIGITVLDPELRFLKANPAFCRLLGHPEAELRRATYTEVTDPVDRDDDLAAVRRMLAGERDHHRGLKRFLDREGRPVRALVDVTLSRDADGRPLSFVVQAEDLREKEKMLSALADAERRFRGIFNAAYAFMGLMSPDGTLLEANRSALEFAGVTRADVVGRPYWETAWWDRSEESRRRVREAVARAAGGEVVRFEIEVSSRPGRTLLADFSITPVLDEAGRVILLVPEGFDVTARKAAEHELRRHQERLEELVGTRTSELNRSERRARLLRDVAATANEAETPEAVLLAALRGLAELGGWSAGHALVRDAEGEGLVDSGVWFLADEERLRGLAGAKRGMAFAPGEGLPGTVLLEGRPAACRLDAGIVPLRVAEAARAAGLVSAQALPVTVKGRVVAVLELFGETERALGGDELELAAQVGRQAGIAYARLLAETTLRKLSMAVEHSPVSVLITDREGRLEYVNPAFETATGHSVHEVLGKTPRILKSGVHPQPFYEQMWRTILGGETWRGELCNRRRDGSLFWESAVISPIRGEGGEVTNLVAVKLDITERKEAERRLERAKEEAERANRAKSVFLASMSHEIRTPLNAILGFSQLLMGDTGLSRLQKERLAAINTSGEHLLALINDVLEMSKIEAGRTVVNPVPTDLPALLRDMEVMFRRRAEEKRLSFEVQEEAGVPGLVAVDQGKLRQILVNLLGNAVKYTRAGGVVVRVRAHPRDEGGLELDFDVEDTGAGIEEEDLPRLFRQFEQASAGQRAGGGTGLGLALSRALSRLMGGDIGVQTRAGVGSVFRLTLPVEAAEETAPREDVSARRIERIEPGQPSRKVLVVDDVEENRAIVSAMLGRVGYEVHTANDGETGLGEVTAWHPDLVLMDLRMPGMDGLEAIRTLRRDEAGPRIPVVALTASAFEEDRRQVEEAGGDDFLGKPFREPELLRKVGKLLGVRYVLAEDADASGGPPPPVSGEALRVAEPFRGRLREAVVTADVEALRAAIDELAQADAAAAGAVADLAERFEYERLLELLGP